MQKSDRFRKLRPNIWWRMRAALETSTPIFLLSIAILAIVSLVLAGVALHRWQTKLLHLVETKPPRTASSRFLKEKFARLASDLKAEAHVVHSSIDAEHEHIDALEYSIDKKIKGIEEALRNGRLSLTDLELAMEEQRNQFEEDISDKTRSFEKLLENALKREIGDLEKRMAEKMKLLKENKTLVVEDEKQKNSSGFPKELRRLEDSQREALNNLKKNVNTVLLQLLNQTGIGKCLIANYAT